MDRRKVCLRTRLLDRLRWCPSAGPEPQEDEPQEDEQVEPQEDEPQKDEQVEPEKEELQQEQIHIQPPNRHIYFASDNEKEM